MSASERETETFIPDLCRVRAVFLVLVTTELVAILFALVRGTEGWLDWDYLGLVSLFGQWTVLSSSALVCLMRNRLNKLGIAGTTMAVLVIVLADVAFFTLAAEQLLYGRAPGFDWRQLSRNLIIAGLITLLVLRYFYLQHLWRFQKQAELQSRLGALQARIHPHFLFNSMNSIAALIDSDPRRAENAVLDLSELFRASLRTDQQWTGLQDELALCQRYLAIESLRLEHRLQQEWKLDPDASHQALPPLTLQPLLENAIYHGIQPRPEGGLVQVETERRGPWVYILIRNPLPPEQGRQHEGNRMALANIRARLEMLFDDQAVLKASRHDGWYTVTLRLPWRDNRSLRKSPQKGTAQW
ncbi:sensor histidine kinase [Hydrocarboniclastica marina]|uniref:Sensor histidine kinase n=1 Tax=Hydrocarboniclastica marina TaxID=2259620 RepID=A0A4P7XKE8_9ALTE|nr:histidine kinase [Hydrocarboniclastica marina]QCF27365.1 sensor histidine kinase [Hydrocarboniclastica marina]